MEPYREIVEQAFLNRQTQVINTNYFTQQEKNKVQTEICTVINDLLDDHENDEDNAMAFEGHLNLPVYTTLIKMPDNELNEKIRLLQKQKELFNIILSRAKRSVKKQINITYIKNRTVAYIFDR